MHPTLIFIESHQYCNLGNAERKTSILQRWEQNIQNFRILYRPVVQKAFFLPFCEQGLVTGITSSPPGAVKKMKIMKENNQLMKKFRLRFVSHLSQQKQETFYSGSWRAFDINPADMQGE